MIKVIAYNANTAEFKEEEVGTIEDYYRLLDCHTFDIVQLDNNVDIYIDDEGLYVANQIITPVVSFRGAIPIAGNIVITGGADREGDTLPVSITMEQAKNIIVSSRRYTINEEE